MTILPWVMMTLVVWVKGAPASTVTGCRGSRGTLLITSVDLRAGLRRCRRQLRLLPTLTGPSHVSRKLRRLLLNPRGAPLFIFPVCHRLNLCTDEPHRAHSRACADNRVCRYRRLSLAVQETLRPADRDRCGALSPVTIDRYPLTQTADSREPEPEPEPEPEKVVYEYPQELLTADEGGAGKAALPTPDPKQGFDAAKRRLREWGGGGAATGSRRQRRPAPAGGSAGLLRLTRRAKDSPLVPLAALESAVARGIGRWATGLLSRSSTLLARPGSASPPRSKSPPYSTHISGWKEVATHS